MKQVKLGSRVLPVVYICLLLGLIPNTDTYASNSNSSDTSSKLQQDIVRDMAKGLDVSKRVVNYVKKYSSAPRAPAIPRSNTAAQMQLSLITLRKSLNEIVKQGGLTQQNHTQFSTTYSVLQASNLLLQEKLKQIEALLLQINVASKVEQRRLQEQQRYKNLITDIFDELDYIETALRTAEDINVLFTETSLLDALLGDFKSKANKRIANVLSLLKQHITTKKSKILRANTLPYRQLGISNRNPVITPVITPAYLDNTAITSNAEDLNASAAAPLSNEILAKAKSLDNDYIKIYDFVRSQIKTEWYAGSMKGAAGTLRQLSGNDVDQASLLIALFRASGLPSRYVQGVVELPIEAVMESLAITDANQAVKALTKSGVAYSPQIRGGRVAAVHVEQVWVEAFVPYNNYRGSMIDKTGASWLPLMPNVKSYSSTVATNILKIMALDNEAEINAYLSQPQESDFLAALIAKVENYLNLNGQPNTYDAQLGSTIVQVDNIGLIPHTLPVKVIAVTGEYASLPGLMRHQIRFVLRNADKDNAAIVLDYTVPVAEIASERVTVSYIPATVDDQRTVNKFGGMDNVPAYLVKLRPQIKINGRAKSIASDSVAMGIDHRLEIYVNGPHGSEQIDQTVIAGGYHAVAVNAQRHVSNIVEDDPADTDFLGPKILSQFGNAYSKQWQAAEQELAGLHDVAVIRPLASVAIISNVYKVDMVLGQPHQIEFQGVSLDAALRIAEPVSRSNNTASEKAWMQMSALQGSILESKIFDSTMGEDVGGLSADLGLQLASEQGITVHTINSSNSSTVIPTLIHPVEVIADIENWIRLGLNVQVPATQTIVNDWTGSVWRVEDPTSGAAGYFISGGLAGGTTTTYPRGWLISWYYWALAAANSPAPNSDPLSVTSITKVNTSEGLGGKAGKPLDNQLSVMLRDIAGLPVAGATVTFIVADGGGDFEGEQSVTAESDFSGIAAVDFTLGKSTKVNERYVYEFPTDRYRSRAGGNIIDISVPSYQGTLLPTEPYFVLGFANEPTRLARTDFYVQGSREHAGKWADNIFISPADEFGNVVSNIDVTFSISGGGNTCTDPSFAVSRGAVFNGTSNCPEFPIHGECGSSSLTNKSYYDGTAIGVILGKNAAANYSVKVTAANVPERNFSYRTIGGCSNSPYLVNTYQFYAGNKGQNISAAKPGDTYGYPVNSSLVVMTPDAFGLVPVRVDAAVNHTVTNGGSASAASRLGKGIYASDITTGILPGTNAVTIHVSNIDSPVEDIAALSRSFRLNDVYGVLPTVTGTQSFGVPEGVDANGIIINETDQTEYVAEIAYNINPAYYLADKVVVNIYEDGARIYQFNGSNDKGDGIVRIPRSTRFDPDYNYETEIVVNPGSFAQVKSDKEPLRIAHRLFKNVSRHVSAYLDIDLLNNLRCEKGTDFKFTLTENSVVNLKFINRSDESEIILIDDVEYTKGEHLIEISPFNLYPGKYKYELNGVSTETSVTELKKGSAVSQFKTQDRLPVGHTMVKGVNVYNGSLSLGGTDLSVAGRGAALELRRSYSSKADAEAGIMGVGWTHNYDSKVVINSCGQVIVIGGQGGGMRFVEGADGKLKALKGYHGTLEPDFTNNTFDFYSKDGTQYHYRLFFGRSEWNLEYIIDTNGNTTRLAYDPLSRKEAKLVLVEDSAGRQLRFRWDDKYFIGSQKRRPVIVAVEGPDGMRVNYEYDQLGNMTRAARVVAATTPNTFNDLRADSYSYNIDPATRFAEQHKVISHTNPNGAVTNYTYNEIIVDITLATGGAVAGVHAYMPYGFIKEIKDPEGGITKFDYDTPHSAALTTVTDGRNNPTTYTMNNYGSTLSITDPLSNKTTMTWATDDVLMLSRTDANNVKTTYTHDVNANVLTEKVDTGVLTSYTITNTYASIPNKPWIKNRLATRTDRNGFTSTYEYDGNGNLIIVTDAEENIVKHTYSEQGDRISTRDARGNTTTFNYDVYGNLGKVFDPLGHTITTVWNNRSLPVSRRDSAGNLTTFRYDDLDRLLVKTDPYTNTRSFSYDAVGNKLTEEDEEGRVTTSTYDLENRVKTVTNPLLDVMSYSYDAVGNKTRQIDWRGNSTTFDYDTANRLETLTEPHGKITRYSYDGVGNVKTQTDAESRVTAFDYDALNRRITTTDALTGIISVEYDGVNKIKQTDQLNRSTSYDYDKINRLVTQTEPLGRVSKIAYDENSNKVSETDPNGNVQTYIYDAANRLYEKYDAYNFITTLFYDLNSNVITEVDRRLHETKHEYDRLNRRISTLDQEGFKTESTYDKVGNVLTQTLPNTNVITHTYDVLNRLKTSSDKEGSLLAVNYDANGNRSQVTDANGNVTTHTYDFLNRLTQSDLPEVRTVKFTYDRVGNKKTETDPRNKVMAYDYDDLNRLTTMTDADLKTVVSTYDAVSNKKTEKDKRGFTTSFDYDDLNRLTKVTDPLTQVMTYSYDFNGNKLSDTDKRGTLTKYTYDKENRLATVTKDNLLINKLDYDEVGNKKFDTDANGNIIAYVYDKRNLLTKESHELAAISNFTYDDIGNKRTERDPEGRFTTWTYDLRRRVLTQKNGADETTTNTYDGNGNRLTTRRPNGNTWVYAYDGADRTTSITDGETTGVTTFTYDGNSNKLTQTDANTNATTYTYDNLNRQKTTTYIDGANEVYNYDENGNRTSLIDAKGQTFSYSYDQLNRETTRTYPAPLASTGDDIQSITTGYDANNNPITVTETYSGVTGTRLTTKAYDNFDRLISVTDAFNKKIAYTYDANGNRTTLIDPDSKITRYSFDALNRLSTVDATAGITTYNYDRSSLQTKVTYPNGTIAENIYDNALRTKKILNRQGAAVISQYDYTYDLNGNRKDQIETNGSTAELTAYAYDDNDRLTLVNYPDAVVSYSYDANYNRITEQSTDKATNTLVVNKTFGYNNRNQLETITDNIDNAQNVVYQFDTNGNQTIKSKNGVTTTFVYDVRDKLLSVRENATTLGQFFYDYQGMRVAKTGDQGLVRYTYDDDSVLLQTDGAGSTLAKYEYGPDRLLSLNHATEGRQYYHFDALGSTVNLTKPDASIQARYQYDAWGNFRSESGTSFNKFAFTGHEKDTETNLYYFKARYYDPDTGRFLSQDPYLGEAGTPPSLHRYLYAYGNPSVYVDLNGYSNSFVDEIVDKANDIVVDAVVDFAVEKTKEVFDMTVDYAKEKFDERFPEDSLKREALLAPVTVVEVLVVEPVDAVGTMVVEVKNGEYKNAAIAGGMAVAGTKAKAIGNFGKKLVPDAVKDKAGELFDKAGDKISDVKDALKDKVSTNKDVPVKPGDRATYSELKERKSKHGETEPVEMHEMPSMAAKKEDFIRKNKRQPNPSEIKMLRDKGVSEAVTPDVHKATRTWFYKNKKKVYQKDADNLLKARVVDEVDLIKAKIQVKKLKK